MDEKRSYKRHYLPLSVQAKYYDKGKPLTENMRLINLSRGGACVTHPNPLNVGSIMNLEIFDCDSGFVNQLGEWSKLHGDLVNLKVQAQVLRNEEFDNTFQNHRIALKFNSPIKIIDY